MPKRVLSRKCVYAVAAELLISRILAPEGREKTLKDVASSSLVRQYCGDALSVSFVHYVEKALLGLRSLVSTTRKWSGPLSGEAGLIAFVSQYGFYEALRILDLMVTVKQLNSGISNSWLHTLARELDDTLCRSIGGRLMREYLLHFFRSAANCVRDVMGAGFTAFSRGGKVPEGLHLKLNAKLEPGELAEPFKVKVNDEVSDLADDIEKHIIETLEFAEDGRGAMELVDLVAKASKPIYARYFAPWNKGRVNAMIRSSISYGVNAYVVKLVAERIAEEVSNAWLGTAASGGIPERCRKLATKVKNRRWRARIIEEALEELEFSAKALDCEHLQKAIKSWVTTAREKDYLRITHIRTYARQGTCTATITIVIREPIVL